MNNVQSRFSFKFETGSHHYVTLTGLDLTMLTQLAEIHLLLPSNPSAAIKGMSHQAWPKQILTETFYLKNMKSSD